MMQNTLLEEKLINITKWLGTPMSFVIHTLFFVISFLLVFLGISFDKILLIVTTAVSLEAIYLAIFIQMTVNRQEEEIREVGEDIEDIQEEVEDISEDIDKIQEEKEEEEEEDVNNEEKNKIALMTIENNLQKVLKEIENIKKTKNK